MVAKSCIRRLTLLVAVGAVLCAGLGIRIALIQIRDGETYRQRARDQQHRVVTIDPRRGRIFDRNRNALALSVEFDSFGIQDLDWAQFNTSDVGNLAVQLSQITGEGPQHIIDRISGTSDFRYLVRWASPETSERIRNLSTYPQFESYIRMEKEARRVYPYRAAAGQVLGFSVDGVGKAGFEMEHNQLLTGIEGYSVVQIDAQRRAYSWLDSYQKSAQNGADVVLTIDIAAQMVAEEVLEETIAWHEALGGMVIMMDPGNGDILAMASAPDFDPNTPGRFPFEAQKIRPVVDIYEPGSTFKIVAATAALETGAFSLEDRIDTSGGRINLGTQTISDHEVFDELSVREVIEHSSNVGTVKMALELGERAFFKYTRAFGFGIKTGVALPGEARGILHKPENWSQSTLPTMAIGYGVSVTGVQLASAYCAVANGGLLLKPRIVKSISKSDGSVASTPRTVVRRVMKEETAEALLGVFSGVVDRGTGTKAAVSGFKVAGKTGTAWKAREDGRGYTRNYRSSFVGMFPAENPEIVVLVMIDEPKKRGFYGGSVAAPVFNKIVRRLVHLPDGPVESVPESEDGLPLHLASIKPNAGSGRAPYLSDPGDRGSVRNDMLSLGGPWEIEQPARTAWSARPARPGAGDRSEQARVMLPSVIGMSIREAVKTLAEQGIEATIEGEGYVRRQIPAPGRMLYSGDRCLIECSPYN